jgi:hypothetical protein
MPPCWGLASFSGRATTTNRHSVAANHREKAVTALRLGRGAGAWRLGGVWGGGGRGRSAPAAAPLAGGKAGGRAQPAAAEPPRPRAAAHMTTLSLQSSLSGGRRASRALLAQSRDIPRANLRHPAAMGRCSRFHAAAVAVLVGGRRVPGGVGQAPARPRPSRARRGAPLLAQAPSRRRAAREPAPGHRPSGPTPSGCPSHAPTPAPVARARPAAWCAAPAAAAAAPAAPAPQLPAGARAAARRAGLNYTSSASAYESAQMYPEVGQAGGLASPPARAPVRRGVTIRPPPSGRT